MRDEDLQELFGSFKFERSQRGKPILLYDNFRFRKERSLNNVIRWRCVTKNCKGEFLSSNKISKIIIVQYSLTGRLTLRSGQVEKYVGHDICPLKRRQLIKQEKIKTEFVSYEFVPKQPGF